MNNNDSSYHIPWIIAFTKVLTDVEEPDKVRLLRLGALQEFLGNLNHYKGLGYRDELLYTIAEEKSEMILNAKTKAEMKKILHPKLTFNGEIYSPGEYHIPEEELICWNEVFMKAPLNPQGHRRYMELFQMVFPKENEEINSKEPDEELSGERKEEE